jgi:hypothetical protein
MEVRCGKCNKLFRVSDDKITGTGIKFSCSRCGEYVKITQEEFEQYKLSRETVSALASFEPKPKGKSPEKPDAVVETALPPAAEAPTFDLGEPPAETSSSFDLSEPSAEPSASFDLGDSSAESSSSFDLGEPSAEPSSGFDLGEPSGGDFAQKEEPSPAFDQPISLTEPVVEPTPVLSQPEVMGAPRAETKPSVPAEPAAPKGPVFDLGAILARKAETVPTSEAVKQPEQPPVEVERSPQPEEPVETISASAEAARVSSGIGKKLLILVAVLLIIAAAAFAGAKWYFGGYFQQATEELKAELLSNGLQIVNATGMIAPENGDLVITGTIANTSTKAKSAWYIVAEVYNAQNSVIFRARMLNGRQLYDRRDYEILKKRGRDAEALKKNTLEPGIVIPPKGTANFEIRIMEPPDGIASFNVAFMPFNPIQVLKEMAEKKSQQ